MSGRNRFCSERRPCSSSVGLMLSAWCKVTYLATGRVLRIEGLSHSCTTGWYVIGSGACSPWSIEERTKGGPKVVLFEAGNLDIADDCAANAEAGEAMKFVLASWGSRGDVEPNLAVGRELVRRGDDGWLGG